MQSTRRAAGGYWFLTPFSRTTPMEQLLRQSLVHLILNRLFVDQHADGWCFQIVELAASNRLHASPHRGGAHGDSDWQSNVQDAHLVDSRNVRLVNVIAITEIELIGISTAAINGVIAPAMANTTAKTL